MCVLSFSATLVCNVSILAMQLIYICVYITNYVHFITMFLSF